MLATKNGYCPAVAQLSSASGRTFSQRLIAFVKRGLDLVSLAWLLLASIPFLPVQHRATVLAVLMGAGCSLEMGTSLGVMYFQAAVTTKLRSIRSSGTLRLSAREVSRETSMEKRIYVQLCNFSLVFAVGTFSHLRFS